MSEESTPGPRFRDLRIRDGLTQAQVAEILGKGQVYISQVESGTRVPSLGWLFKVAEAMGWDPHELDPRLASNRGVEVLS